MAYGMPCGQLGGGDMTAISATTARANLCRLIGDDDW